MNAARELPQESQLPCVLYVDDDAGNRQAFKSTFRGQLRVLVAQDLSETWEHLTTSHVHVVIADQRMPGTQGSELLTLVRERYPQVQRMLIKAYSDLEAIIDAVNNAGVVQYITKPWDAQRIMQAVQRAYVEYLRDEERTAYTEQLLEANRQLEFALRQRLLS